MVSVKIKVPPWQNRSGKKSREYGNGTYEKARCLRPRWNSRGE